MPLTPLEIINLRALLDRLIPADEFPGALGAGTDSFVIDLLAGDCAGEATDLLHGLAQLDVEAAVRHGQPFAALLPVNQDALLTALEQNHPATVWPAPLTAAGFLNRMVDIAAEGFYADPANGGNRGAASWRMVGYDPRLPTNPTAT